MSAWRAGLPSVLNADEQGLGKTLQTIAFLTWLKAHMAQPAAADRGPILIVAPTSLLRNWEQEVEAHVEGSRGLGTLVRLYGGILRSQKRRDSRGTRTQSGLPQLDLGWLDEAFVNRFQGHLKADGLRHADTGPQGCGHWSYPDRRHARNSPVSLVEPRG